jgi:hypothetical protein
MENRGDFQNLEKSYDMSFDKTHNVSNNQLIVVLEALNETIFINQTIIDSLNRY